ncbi:MAG: rRNA methylase [Chlorobi bacterium OLB7]|nr:MAG: rRNA methylase [Chlorobi bacterium OLB7]
MLVPLSSVSVLIGMSSKKKAGRNCTFAPMRKLSHEELLAQRLTAAEVLSTVRHPVVGILEDIRSLYNVGSCFRTADAMLLQRLILTGYTPTPPRKEISKTALGATETVPWEFVANGAEAVAMLRLQGYRTYALELTDSSLQLGTAQLPPGPIAFVAGNEITGVSAATLAACDGAIEIPMHGVKHSLNVAVAFGIAAWELVKKGG